MSNESDDRPLEKWTTGNLLGLFGFVAMIVTGWANLSDRLTKVEAQSDSHIRTDSELRGELREVNANLVRLMVANGVKPEGGGE